jgi:purine-binding chemotaxis protein CheW
MSATIATPTATGKPASARAAEIGAPLGGEREYVTFAVGAQLFGLPINAVHEVFAAHQITPVPLSPSAVVGLLNLRGRVVTAVCLRTLLNVSRQGAKTERMAIGVENQGEAFALLVDKIGDVMRLNLATLEPCPIHMSEDWQALAEGVHRLQDSILVILDLERLIANRRLAA